MRVPLATVAAYLCLIVLLVACGQEATSSTSIPRASATSRSAFQQAQQEESEGGKAPEATVTVAAAEWQLVAETTRVDAEDVKFVVTNNGTLPHSFGIRQNGEQVAFMRDLLNIQPGQSQSLVAALQPGEYELIDPATYQVNGRSVTGSAMGMRVTFTVV